MYLNMYYSFIEEIIRSPRFRSVLEVGGDEYQNLCVRLGKKYLSCDLKSGLNAESMPFSDKSFDLVFGQDTFHIMDNPFEAIHECVRVARCEFWLIDWHEDEQREREARNPLGRHIWSAAELRNRIPCRTWDRSAAFHRSFLGWKGRIMLALRRVHPVLERKYTRPVWLAIKAVPTVSR